MRQRTNARRSSGFVGYWPRREGERLQHPRARQGGSIPDTYAVFATSAGAHAGGAPRRGGRMIHPPERGLAPLGVEEKEVRDVVLTHLHYAHVGNFGFFPAATFHLQDEEMAYATGRHMAQGFFNYAYEADEVAAMVREVYKGRVCFHDGDAELAPGLSLHRIGGHTKGLQAVRVRTRIGW